MKRRRLVGSMLGTAAVGLAGVVHAAPTLVLGRVNLESALADEAEVVVREAGRRAGVVFEIRRFPVLRAIEAANDGELDGDLMRIADVGARYANLVQVGTPVTRVDLAVYGANADIARRSRAEIERMRLGIVRGLFVLEKHTRGLQTGDAVSSDVVAHMLANGRFDAAVMAYLDTETSPRKQEGHFAHLWPWLWATEPLYTWLHHRHAALVPRLDQALRDMQREGWIERRYRRMLASRNVAPLPPDRPR